MELAFETEDGRRVAVKRASDGDEAARLRREADLLDVAGHPGLVEVVRFDDGPSPVLRTSYVDGSSLAEERAFDLDEVAGVVAAVASTIADLHTLGVVHGAVFPEHVLLDRDGRPVLCSLGSGGLAGERLPDPPRGAGDFVDPERTEAEVLDPAFDVFGIGALLAFLLTRAGGRARGGGGEALRRIASGAMSVPAAERPTARALADAVHDAVGGARLPKQVPEGAPAADALDRLEARRGPLEGWRRTQAPAPICPRRRRAGVVGVLTVLGVGVVGAALFVLPRRPPPERSAAQAMAPTTAIADPTPPPTVGQPPATLAQPTTTVMPEPPRQVPAGCPDVDGPLAADVDGDACPEAVRWHDGVVEAGGSRWAVGQAGDVITVGDWMCSGRRALAVLRPQTGDVFAFSAWASAAQDMQAPRVAQVAGGQALRPADVDGDGCNEIVVERTSGAPAVVWVPRPQR